LCILFSYLTKSTILDRNLLLLSVLPVFKELFLLSLDVSKGYKINHLSTKFQILFSLFLFFLLFLTNSCFISTQYLQYLYYLRLSYPTLCSIKTNLFFILPSINKNLLLLFSFFSENDIVMCFKILKNFYGYTNWIF